MIYWTVFWYHHFIRVIHTTPAYFHLVLSLSENRLKVDVHIIQLGDVGWMCLYAEIKPSILQNSTKPVMYAHIATFAPTNQYAFTCKIWIEFTCKI